MFFSNQYLKFADLGNFLRVRVSLQVAHHEVKLLAENVKKNISVMINQQENKNHD